MRDDINIILDEYVNGLSSIIGYRLDKIILFGSYARNTQDMNGETSDIDIMILINTSENDIKEIEKAVWDYSYDMDLKYNILLSPIIETVDNYEKRIGFMPFYKNVEKEGVILNA